MSEFFSAASLTQSSLVFETRNPEIVLIFSFCPIELSLPLDINLGMPHEKRAKGRRK